MAIEGVDYNLLLSAAQRAKDIELVTVLEAAQKGQTQGFESNPDLVARAHQYVAKDQFLKEHPSRAQTLVALRPVADQSKLWPRHPAGSSGILGDRGAHLETIRGVSPQNEALKLVRLKNGFELPLVLVKVTMLSLGHLMQSNPIAFYELVMKCRDLKHVFWGDTGKVLKNLGLLEPWDSNTPQKSIRIIVLAAVEGEGLKMKLTSPILESKSAPPVDSSRLAALAAARIPRGKYKAEIIAELSLRSGFKRHNDAYFDGKNFVNSVHNFLALKCGRHLSDGEIFFHLTEKGGRSLLPEIVQVLGAKPKELQQVVERLVEEGILRPTQKSETERARETEEGKGPKPRGPVK
jgi:hypothetical protein